MSISGKLQGLTEKGWKTYIATVEKTCTCLSMASNKRSLGGVICGGCVKMVIPKPPALVETPDYTNAELYPEIYVAMKTLLTYPYQLVSQDVSSVARRGSKCHFGAQCLMRDCLH